MGHTFLPPSKQSPLSTYQAPGTFILGKRDKAIVLALSCQNEQSINMDISQYNCCCPEETLTQYMASGCSKLSTPTNGACTTDQDSWILTSLPSHLQAPSLAQKVTKLTAQEAQSPKALERQI